MQVFRMHEYVRLGTAEEALEHRAHWLERGVYIFESVGLRVQTEVAADAIQPDTWQIDNANALRSTLQDIIDALARIQEARQRVAQIMAEAHQRFNLAASSESREWALSFSKRFETVASLPRYQVSTALAPALASISRARVLSLLSLGLQ